MLHVTKCFFISRPKLIFRFFTEDKTCWKLLNSKLLKYSGLHEYKEYQLLVAYSKVSIKRPVLSNDLFWIFPKSLFRAATTNFWSLLNNLVWTFGKSLNHQYYLFSKFKNPSMTRSYNRNLRVGTHCT